MKKLVFLLTIILFFSCKGPQEKGKTIEDYYPLASGNRWTYERQTQESTDTIKREIAGVRIASDKSVYRVLEINEGKTDTLIQWYVFFKSRICNRGLVMDVKKTSPKLRIYRDKPFDSTNTYKEILKEPLREGKKWLVSNKSGDSCWIESVDITITVPAGTFENCIKVIKETNAFNIYAPGAGPVGGQSPGETYRLIDYKIR